jgi:outer membrane protein assembly factor BamB
MKRKVLLTILVTGILTLYLFRDVILTQSPTSANFPLRQVWANRLNSNVLGLSLASKDILLVRTRAALYALDTKNGTALWKYSLSGQADPKPAVVNNGNVYVTDGRSLIALDQDNGTELWKQPLPFSASWVTDTTNGLVVVNQPGMDIMVYDSSTGKFLRREPVCRGYVKAVISNQDIVIPCDGLEAVNIMSGEVSWKVEIDGVIGSVDNSDEILYYYANSVHAFDMVTQKTLWSTPLSNNGLANLKVLKDKLFYRDASRLCMLDRNQGHLKWCIKIPSPQAPAMVGEIVYVFNGNHKKIRAIGLEGDQVGTLHLANFNYFSIDRELMASTEDLLFFSSGKLVYAFGE